MTYKDPSFKAIIPFVLLLHVSALAWLVTFSISKEPPPNKKPMVVSTIKLQPKPQVQKLIAAAAPESLPKPFSEPVIEPVVEEERVIHEAPEEKVAPVKPPSPKPKKAQTPPPPPPKPKAPPKPAKKPTPKPKPQPKKETPPPKKAPEIKKAPKQEESVNSQEVLVKTKQLELLAQAKAKIGKMGANKEKFAQNSSSVIAAATPSRIEALEIDTLMIESDTVLSVKETAYRDELSHRLKLLLKLPEYGDVKVKLTLDRSGNVVSVKILSAQSKGNRAYIEKTLPKIKLPPFGNNFEDADQYTFTITMSNE